MTLTFSGVKVKVRGQGQGHVTPHFDRADARNRYLLSFGSWAIEVSKLAFCQYSLAPCQFVYFVPRSLQPDFPSFPTIGTLPIFIGILPILVFHHRELCSHISTASSLLAAFASCRMLYNFNYDCTCWSQLATSASVDVNGIFVVLRFRMGYYW